MRDLVVNKVPAWEGRQGTPPAPNSPLFPIHHSSRPSVHHVTAHPLLAALSAAPGFHCLVTLSTPTDHHPTQTRSPNKEPSALDDSHCP